MRSLLRNAAAGLLLATAPAAAQTEPTPPKLAYAFTVRVELAQPVEQGQIDGGRRRFVPITGGTISGPRLTGTVLPGGGDWQTIYPGGLTRLEARYLLKAADGTVIGVCTSGSPSPTLGLNIGLGYVPPALAEIGTRLGVDCRGRAIEARVVKTPFYKRPANPPGSA